MDLTSEGIAQAVFGRMAEKQCDEQAATEYVYQKLLRSAESLKELWREEGRRIIHRWTGESLRGFNGAGPRPAMPANYGTSRRKAYHTEVSHLDCLIKVAGEIRRIGALTGKDLDLIVAEYEGIVARNQYHADEMRHVRAFVEDDAALDEVAERLDNRATEYLKSVARLPGEGVREEAAA